MAAVSPNILGILQARPGMPVVCFRRHTAETDWVHFCRPQGGELAPAKGFSRGNNASSSPNAQSAINIARHSRIRTKVSEGKMPMPPKPANVLQRHKLGSRVFGAQAQNTESSYPNP